MVAAGHHPASGNRLTGKQCAAGAILQYRIVHPYLLGPLQHRSHRRAVQCRGRNACRPGTRQPGAGQKFQ
ncbi:hypothetical protein D3C85_1596140 [compost metagenome]